MKPIRLAFVGGGAAGFFGAIRAAEVAKKQKTDAEIYIFESSSSFLKKVRISGGGRCNVTHNCFDVKTLVQNYPRGSKELISPMQRFQPEDTIAWFKKRDIKIVAESDGRMFPSTNSSETIINCYLKETQRLGIKALTNHVVKKIETSENGEVSLVFKSRENMIFDKVLLATGSSPAGYRFVEELGHKIAERAPSLFSFKINDLLLKDLSGLSFPKTRLQLKIPKSKTFKQAGPMLITHWGLSGPAILKLSAWAAREMKNCEYLALLVVNWLGLETREEALQIVSDLKVASSKAQVSNSYPKDFPKRFWLQLLKKLNIAEDLRWSDVSKKQINALVESIFSCQFEIQGKNRFKDEFVECGGVSLKEVNFKTMQSKLHSSIYFAGELLDVDGVTGGFNFQNAWTTSWIAGEHMLLSSIEKRITEGKCNG